MKSYRELMQQALDAFESGRAADRAEAMKVLRAALATPPRSEWVGLTDEDVMVAAYQAGFDIHEDYDNDDPEEMHWWTPDGEVCDDSLLKLRDIIEAKLKEKNT